MKNNLIPSRIDFEEWQDSFIKRMKLSSAYFSYATINKGLILKLTERIKLTCSSGIGFSSDGTTFHLTHDLFQDIIPANNYYAYLELEVEKYEKVNVVDEKNDTIYSGYKVETTKINFKVKEVDPIPLNPYKHELFNKENASKLVLGFIEKGQIYPLNRIEQESNLPLNATALYRGDFKDYVTFRGCVKVKDENILGKFVKFGRDYSKSGEAEKYLKPEHIPSLDKFSGRSGHSGDHNHGYETYSYKNDGSNYWDNKIWMGDIQGQITTKAGRHSHLISNGNYSNSYVRKLYIEPLHGTLIPIKRVLYD